MHFGKIFRSVKLMAIGYIVMMASSALAVDLQLEDNLQFESLQNIRVDQGEVIPGVYYKVVGLHLSDDERLVTAELEQFFTPLDKRDLDQLKFHPKGATITFENAPQIAKVKGVSNHGRGALMH